MSSVVRMKGRTVEEAIKSALEVLKAKREDVDVKIIEEGEQGVLGVFGGKDAEVEVRLKLSFAEEAKNILQEMLDKAGFVSQVYIREEKDGHLLLEIKTDDPSRIIGKEGITLSAFQYLLNIIANKGKEQKYKIEIDCGGYKVKKIKRLEKLANETADEVEISGKDIELPPMSAKERRVVHMALKNRKNIITQSIGEGKTRRVVVSKKSRG